jgi:cytochrome c556
MPSVDERQAVSVTEPTRLFVLAEMRAMLASAQGVAEAIGTRDWPAAAAAAKASGLEKFRGMPKQIMMELPEDFRALGMESHKAFDAVAAATSAGDPVAVSAKLGDAMQFCVSCHQSFRFAAKQ